jgi:hypothetical protein
MHQSHTHLGLLKSLSKCRVVIKYRVHSILKVPLVAQIQILILGAPIENIGDSAEFQGEIQGLLVGVKSESLCGVAIILLKLDDISVLSVGAGEVCGFEVSGICNND